jgi:LysM domain
MVLAGAGSAPAHAQNLTVTPAQRATAQQVAQTGVPLEELAPNAPDEYTVKRGDTLWAISGIYLRRPWRWPELWGINMQEVRNPHRIYPGQQLYLDKSEGRATLRMRQAGGAGSPPTDTIRVSPRTRYENLADTSLPTLQANLIEPFLAEPLIVNELTLQQAPRIVATQDERVLLSRGDRAYVRTSKGSPPLGDSATQQRDYRVFRNATELRDPVTKAILGYEAQYVGKAQLVRGETVREIAVADGKSESQPIPGTIDIVAAKEEMRVGDRLLPEPARQLISYVPRAPDATIVGSIVSIYGSAVVNAAQSQIVVINRGTADGIESGHVLAILKSGPEVRDRTESSRGTLIKLPDERIGLLMVFRPFERLSYALILEITDGVTIGDRVVNPR